MNFGNIKIFLGLLESTSNILSVTKQSKTLLYIDNPYPRIRTTDTSAFHRPATWICWIGDKMESIEMIWSGCCHVKFPRLLLYFFFVLAIDRERWMSFHQKAGTLPTKHFNFSGKALLLNERGIRSGLALKFRSIYVTILYELKT